MSWAESSRFVPRAFVQPTLRFIRTEAAGGVVMLLAAIAAIVLANTPLAARYFGFFDATISVTFGSFELHHLSELTVREWINDGLMAIFFFVVGLEIKRELVAGELKDPKAAALPVVAALGGMVVPAGIYLAFNGGLDSSHGWGIPMATDIAFAVGVLSMVGNRVPVSAKLFLLALAIVDDLGAILVIAIFYTDELAFGWLATAAAGLVVIAVMRRVSIRATPAYVAIGLLVWLAVLESGVHATVAGVALAFMTPVRSFYSPRLFAPRARALVERAEEYVPPQVDDLALQGDHHTLERVHALMEDLRRLARETIGPLDRLETALTDWSSFVIVPIFAFANAGVRIPWSDLGAAFTEPVVLGVALGLLVGKTVGVAGAAWVAVRLGLGRLPMRTTWRHVIGVAMIAGIGFTVALFVAALSFDPGRPFLDQAKIGIFAASLVAGVLGILWMRFVAPDPAEIDLDHDGVADVYEDEAVNAQRG